MSKRELFDDMTVDEVLESADRYVEETPLSADSMARLDAYKKESKKKRAR